TLPLIAHPSAGAVRAYRAGAPIRAGEFLADVARVAERLGAGRHVLNACADRYHFTVGFAATLVSGRLSLLPSTHTAQVIRQLRAYAPDVVCLTDADDCDIELPRVPYPRTAAASDASPPGTPAVPAPSMSVPAIGAAQPAACVFTSGSTGTPVPHRKNFGPLIACVGEEARRLAIADGTARDPQSPGPSALTCDERPDVLVDRTDSPPNSTHETIS